MNNSDYLTVYHERLRDTLSLAVFNGIVFWGATDQTGAGYCAPLAFKSDVRSAQLSLEMNDPFEIR
jgi:hypothetical protein